MMIDSVVPAIAMASVRPIAAATTRKKSGDRSGGKRLRRKFKTELIALVSNSADGRISAARQQKISTAIKPKMTAARRSIGFRLKRHWRQSLAGAASFPEAFMLFFATITQGVLVWRGVAGIKHV